MSSNYYKILILIIFIIKLIKTNEINKFDSQLNNSELIEIKNDTINLNAENSTTTTLITKPNKKKPYGIVNKSILIDENLGKKFDHTENFDFNLDDLEDIHENFKKGDLNDEEEQLLRDTNNSHFEDFPLELENTEQSIQQLAIETLPSLDRNLTDNMTTILPINQDGTNSSRHIYKVTKNSKTKMKNRELLKKDDFQKNIGNQFNSVDRQILDDSEILVDSEEGGEEDDYFKILVNLYDHFYWQPSEIRTKVSPVCGVELFGYLSALNNNYEWALKAYDSSGRYRGQFLYGNDLWLGARLFCDDLNYKVNQSEREHIEFGFFMATMKIERISPNGNGFTKIIQLGECLPKSCSTHDIQAILELDPHARLFQMHNSNNTIYTIENSSLKPTSGSVQLISIRRVPGDYIIWNDSTFQAFSGICISIVILIILATIYEGHLKTNENLETNKISSKTDDKTNTDNTTNGKTFELFQINSGENNNVDLESNSKKTEQIKNIETITNNNNNNGIEMAQKKNIGIHQQILLCFALGSNGSTVLSIEKSHELISCVHGIRVFSLLWTILVHTYLQVFAVTENRFRRQISERSFIYQMIGNATFSVDSFFFISGLLVVIIFLRHQKNSEVNTKEFIKKGFIRSIFMITYRYIRLTPAYLFVIIFDQLAAKYTFNRAVFQGTVSDDVNCAKFWWRNILYVNNWYPFQELCMIWSWYLANDMQFYIMAIILLVLSTRFFKISLITLLVFLITSWGTAGIFSLHHNYTHKVAQPFESFDFLYDKPWQRIGPYIVGMITGYIIHTVKPAPRVPCILNLFLWLCSIGILFALIFGGWKDQLGLVETAFYVSIGHTAWGLGLVWITLSCCWGLSPTINKFLSYRGFLPISRLTYCAYLIHPVIMLITSFEMDGPMHLEHSMVITVFFGNAVLSILIAFAISVSFEAPVIRLLKIFFKK